MSRDPLRGTEKSSRFRAPTGILVAVVFAFALVGPSPASAQAGRDCDARGGKTLAANSVVRFYRVSDRGDGYRLWLCRYRDGKASRAADIEKRRGVYFYGVSGNWVYYVVELAKPHRRPDGTTRFSEVVVRDADRLTWGREAQVQGYVWTRAALSPDGKVAGLLETQGRILTVGDGPETTGNSAIEVFDPHGRPQSDANPDPVAYTVATAPTGSISDFGVTDGTIVWRTASGLQSAPFGEPAAAG